MTTAVSVGHRGSAQSSSGLLKYVLVRLAGAVAVLFAVSVVVFLFIHLAPGGPENALAGRLASPQKLEAIRAKYGFDQPLVSQYLQYLEALVHFDMGESFSRRTAVTTSIFEAAKITVPLVVISWLVSMTIGVTLGILPAARPGSRLDRIVLAATVVGASAPSFAIGTLLAYVFGVKLEWLPVIGPGDGGLDRLKHLVLPIATVSVSLLASCVKVSRVRIGLIMEEDQMTFARARGLRRSWVVRHVILRNAGVGLVTLSGGLLIALIAGLVVVERMFNLPGLGGLMVDAVREQDIAVLQGITLFVALFVVVVNLTVDLVCMAIDPRLRSRLRGGA
jgi:peptide/nickel transport system permease protein